MSLTPLDLRTAELRRRLRGYEPQQVDQLLELAADALSGAVSEAERLREERDRLTARLAQSEERERELQSTLLRAQRVSEEIVATSQREAQLLVKEAEITADRIVQQAVEQAQGIEGRMGELRARRKELQLKLRSTLELFASILEADMGDEEERRATVHRLARQQPG
jgi:cell division initiation protein